VHPQDGHWFAVTHALQARIPSGKLAAQHMVWGVPWALTRRNSPRRPPGPDSNENVQPNARVSITSSAAPTPKLAAARACHQAAGQPYSPRSNPFAPRPETRTPAGAVTRRLSMRSSASLTASSSGLPAVGELPRDASGARLRAGQARLHAAQCLHGLARSAAWIWDWAALLAGRPRAVHAWVHYGRFCDLPVRCAVAWRASCHPALQGLAAWSAPE